MKKPLILATLGVPRSGKTWVTGELVMQARARGFRVGFVETGGLFHDLVGGTLDALGEQSFLPIEQVQIKSWRRPFYERASQTLERAGGGVALIEFAYQKALTQLDLQEPGERGDLIILGGLRLQSHLAVAQGRGAHFIEVIASEGVRKARAAGMGEVYEERLHDTLYQEALKVLEIAPLTIRNEGNQEQFTEDCDAILTFCEEQTLQTHISRYAAQKDWPYAISSGGVVYRGEDDQSREYLILTRIREGLTSYHLPKGTLELHESLEQCALRETQEETGCIGRVQSYLGSVNDRWVFQPTEITIDKTVHFFLMKYVRTAQAMDAEHDGTVWLSASRARELLSLEPKREEQIISRAEEWFAVQDRTLYHSRNEQ
jgi:8-oxo-dGTP pyrophosphatase MutT (NUDIX family)